MRGFFSLGRGCLLLGLSSLLGLLGLHYDFLEVGLQLLDSVGLVRDLALELSFECLEARDFFITVGDARLDLVLAVEQGLLH